MKRFLLVISLGITAFAQQNEPKTIPLWSGGAPGALGTEDRDIPTLSVYLPNPNQGTGTAVIVCPGGGDGNLALNYQRGQVADLLNSIWGAAVVLKDRLGSP